MRAFYDPAFFEFLLRIGEGTEPMDEIRKITLPNDMVIPFGSKETSLQRSVDDINNIMTNHFPGEAHAYTSTDRTLDECYQGDYKDFLNSQNPKGLLPYNLVLKKSCPLILLSGLNPTEGLCNGTCLICRELKPNTISAKIAASPHKWKQVLLPRIPLQTPDNDKNGIPFKRIQFPVRLCFAMTINKVQEQTLDYMGIYLREPTFSHGQLYFALSRAKASDSVKFAWVRASMSFENIFQRYGYMACKNASKQQMCRFDVIFSDKSGRVTATFFGDLAEKLLTYSTLDAM
nr:uncharacterized protein LOC113709028 [Coffea arabica]